MTKNPSYKITLGWIALVVLLYVFLIILGIIMRGVQGGYYQNLLIDFYSFMTLHGFGMAGTWYVGGMAAISYVSYKYINPSVLVNKIAFFSTIIGLVLLMIAIFKGYFAAGWYFLYPLPFKGGWPAWSTTLFLIATAVLGSGWLQWNLNLLKAIANRYSLFQALSWHYIFGKSEPEIPPFILIITVSLIASVACLLAAIVVIIFYFMEMINGRANDALIMKNLTFFFGHIIVNLTMYLGVALVYEIYPSYCNRPWKNSRLLAISWNFVLLLVLFAYFHHLYMDFAQPLAMQYLGQIASYVSSVPAAIMSVFGVLAITFKAKVKWNLTAVFFFLGIMGWTIGGLAALIDSTVRVNYIFHNTLWVPGHFHTYFVAGVVMMILGYFYHLMKEKTYYYEDKLRLMIITILYTIGSYGVVAMFYAGGAYSIPRRYSVYPADVLINGSLFARIGMFFAMVVLLAVILYVLELFIRWFKAIKVN